MNAQEYIFEKLTRLVEQFPSILCKYEEDEDSGSHYIEIYPKEIFEDDSFTKQKREISKGFIFGYPFETITFLFPGDVLSVENPIRIFKNEAQVINNLQLLLGHTKQNEIDYIFDKFNFGTLVEQLEVYSIVFPKELNQTVKKNESVDCRYKNEAGSISYATSTRASSSLSIDLCVLPTNNSNLMESHIEPNEKNYALSA